MFVFDEDYDVGLSASVDVELPATETIKPSIKGPNRPERRVPSSSGLNRHIPSTKSTDPWSFYEDYFLDYRKLMNEIVLLESPKSSYVVRSRPAILTCKALNAKRIRFKCNSRWLDDSRHDVQEGAEATTGRPYLRATVEISRQEVEANVADLGDFLCQCYASGHTDTQAVRSETAKIRVAYIRKHFYQVPISDRIPEGRTVQLSCVPPDADPKAEIYWVKNNEELQRDSDSNLILANDGSLIISAARLTDSGNYTCEARNLANRRVTDPAQIKVYVDGHWSSWTSWSGACRVECETLKSKLDMLEGDTKSVENMIPKQRRTRTCNNPAPLNGGQPCFGEEEEFKSCTHKCLINGSWSKWTNWSECNDQCQRIRSRSCSAPSPLNGGTFCQGLDLESTNCTSSNSNPHCLPGSLPLPIPGATPSSRSVAQNENPSNSRNQSIVDNEMLVYASLGCVAFLLLIIMLLVAALFCRRKRCFNSAKKDNIYFPENSGHVRTMLLQQQKQSLLGDFIASETKLSRNSPTPFLALSNATTLNTSGLLNANYTLKSAKSINSSGYSVHRKITGSRAALITDYSSNGSASSAGSSGCGKITLLRSESRNSADENYATLYDYTKYTPSIRTCTEDFSSSEQDSATIIAAQVDAEPSRIELKRSGVALYMSAKTFLEERMIFLAVSDDINERPFLQESETCLSSVIIFGLCESEPETILCRPAVISFEHCASMFPKDNWQLCVYADWGQGNGWEVACKLGEENLNTPIYTYLERQRCHLMTDQFGRFCLVGHPKKANVAAQKRVHLAAYCTPMSIVRNELSIRVYCVPEIGMAIESVRKQEEGCGILLAEAEDFLIRDKGSLCFCLEDISSDYAPKAGCQYLEIPDTHHLWCSQNGLHCCIVVCKRTDSVQTKENSTETLAGRIVIYQKGNSSERQILEFNMEKPPPENGRLKCEEKLVSTEFQLSSEIKRHLTLLLDPPTNPEMDWRGLAKKLGYERYIQFFATRPGCSPTSLILDLWESCVSGSETDESLSVNTKSRAHTRARALLDLLQTLRVMGRSDAVMAMESLDVHQLL